MFLHLQMQQKNHEPEPNTNPPTQTVKLFRAEEGGPHKGLLWHLHFNLLRSIHCLLSALFVWPKRWIISGAPVLSYCILLGASKGYHIIPHVHLWTLLAMLNFLYGVASTSWLLHGVFVTLCYPTIFFACLFQFNSVARTVRGNLRPLLKHLQFVHDKIAFFDLPALEIDTDVDGLMVIQGVTISLSKLAITVHEVELVIKVSEDIEISIQAPEVTVSLFRRIEIGHVYGNLKSGKYEMAFAQLEKLEGESKIADEEGVLVTDTPLLKAAAVGSEACAPPSETNETDRLTKPSTRHLSSKPAFESITRLYPDEEEAREKYQETLEWIQETSKLHSCQEQLKKSISNPESAGLKFDLENPKAFRAAVCSQLHSTSPFSHPPHRSIKVTTLQNLLPPSIRRFLHRLPMLLRLLLFLLSYFHPISIDSITVAGSGKWIKHTLITEIFQSYSTHNLEIRHLEGRISSWLSDANFIFEFLDITALAQVPFLPTFDITAYFSFKDVMTFRAVPREALLQQVIRLGGADATFTIPSFLLPHHEHILPLVPTPEAKEELAHDIVAADGKPKKVQAERTLEQARKDETNVVMSVHASLPAVFDQELLNFVAALVKAVKLVDMAKEPSAMDEDVDGFRDFAKNVHQATKDGLKKTVAGGMVNDKWIAWIVGKIMDSLETAQGDVGYSGNIPVELGKYRPREGVVLASKLLV